MQFTLQATDAGTTPAAVGFQVQYAPGDSRIAIESVEPRDDPAVQALCAAIGQQNPQSLRDLALIVHANFFE